MCFRVETCCCGFGVKPATLILLWYDLLPAILILFPFLRSDTIGPLFVVCFIIIVIMTCVMGLYAVSKTKSTYLVPYIIIRILWTIFAIGLALIPLAGAVGISAIKQIASHRFMILSISDSHAVTFDLNSFIPTSYKAAILIGIAVLLFIVYEIHVMIVIVSCFMELYEAEESKRSIMESLVMQNMGLNHRFSASAPAPEFCNVSLPPATNPSFHANPVNINYGNHPC